MSMLLRLSLTLFLGTTIGHSTAHAADNTRYVSITGKNTNPCTLAQPCKTLQRGISQTPAGGELRILDSGFYGNIANIKKSLTITGNGHTVYLGASMTINNADAVVALRRLVLNGEGGALRGIDILAAAAVHIEGCVVHGFTHDGILSTGADVELTFIDSIARDNGLRGVSVQNGAKLTVDNARFENNASSGLDISLSAAAVTRSVAAGNGLNGIASSGSISIVRTLAAHNSSAGYIAFSPGQMTLESSEAHNNGTGLRVGVGGTAVISNSTFFNNGIGINNSGTARTRENNTVSGNGTDLTGTALVLLGGV